jgi:spore maturation protein SpmB
MIAGFSLMFLSGALLFTAHAAKAYANSYFRAKIALIVLAGVNTAVYHVTIDRRRAEWSNAAVPPLAARVAGLVSLVLWFSVIAAGRIFAYDL